MSQSPESGTTEETLRSRIEDADARIHMALMERAHLTSELLTARKTTGLQDPAIRPSQEAEVIRQRVERHEGDLPLATVEHIWRDLIAACALSGTDYSVHLDTSSDVVGVLDLARFYFGFSVELLTAGDPADVVAAVAASAHDLGVVALNERVELPWWRGLSGDGAQISARLPFLMQEGRPSDVPALVISRPPASDAALDIAAYDARWSDRLPVRLMDQGIEVLSFNRSAQGVDALLAVSGDLTADAVVSACHAAGAEPDVLRRVGGYCAPIDLDGDAEADFDSDFVPAAEGKQE